jgi:hypothetical protein
LYQWQIPGGVTGNYFSSIFESPFKLGITNTAASDSGEIFARIPHTYIVETDLFALKTRSNGILDTWSHNSLNRLENAPVFGDIDMHGKFVLRGIYAPGCGSQMFLDKTFVRRIER